MFVVDEAPLHVVYAMKIRLTQINSVDVWKKYVH